MSNGAVAVATVNFGDASLLRQNLATMVDGCDDWIVIVVDNFSTGANRADVAAFASEQGWDLIASQNRGFGGGVNLAASRAWESGADVLLMINPDASIDRANVARLVTQLRAEPSTVVAPVVRRPDGRPWARELQMDWSDGTIRNPRRDPAAPGEQRLDWLSGACFGITRELWARCGGFDDDYFLYWEDIDFSKRVADAGGTVRVLHDVEAWHDEGGTQVAGRRHEAAKSGLYYYYNIVNRMVFAAKHLERDDYLRWRRRIVPNAWSILLRGGRRQFLHSTEPLVSGVRGIRDAYRVAHDRGSPGDGRGGRTRPN